MLQYFDASILRCFNASMIQCFMDKAGIVFALDSETPEEPVALSLSELLRALS